MLKNEGIVGVFVNYKKDTDMKYINIIKDILNKNSVEHRLVNDVGENLSDIKLLIVLGGDGTILGVVRRISDLSIPLFNVNIGTLGFLSEVEINEFAAAVPLLVNDKGTIEERLMIEAACGNDIHTAVNEFCIMNEDRQKMVHVSVYINGDKAGKFDADGILVSTPTGASAYSLSAGGPIVYPNTNCLLITPVCAHSIAARPIVVNADDTITVKSDNGDVILATDWQKQKLYGEENEIKIKKSTKTVKFYKLNEHGFFDRMREKLIYNISR